MTHVGSVKLVEPYLHALELEMDRLAERRPGGPLQTVYLGGGTPSMLTPGQIDGLLRAVETRFGIRAGAEVTMEAHPATVTAETLRGYRATGVTRMSFGVESLHTGELAALGRPVDPAPVLKALDAALRGGFASVAADLMYGLPGQTLATWQETLTRLLDTGVHHLSLYPLMIEPRTVFARLTRANRLQVPRDDDVVEMYNLACRTLRDAGYGHYEVGSWCLPGHRSRHNLAYWHDREYYAVGAGAHGYLHPFRTGNLAGTSRYIRALSSGVSPVDRVEEIDAESRRVESVMLRLRLLEDGLDFEEMRRLHNIDMPARYADDLAVLASAGLITVADGRLRLTEGAVPVANEVWGRLVA